MMQNLNSAFHINELKIKHWWNQRTKGQRRLLYINVLFIAIIIGLISYFLWPKAPEHESFQNLSVAEENIPDLPDDIDPEQGGALTIGDWRQGSTIYYSGKVLVPTPCFVVEKHLEIDRSAKPHQVKVLLNSNDAAGNKFCAQLMTEVEVKGKVEDMHKDAELKFMYNGQEVEFETHAQPDK